MKYEKKESSNKYRKLLRTEEKYLANLLIFFSIKVNYTEFEIKWLDRLFTKQLKSLPHLF